MNSLTMDYPLTVQTMMNRAETLFGHVEVVSRLPDKSCHRTTYAEVTKRARRLAAALHELGIQSGDRVATLGWNHSQHLEAYLGVPSSGAVLHTLNLRLHPDELAYIVDHAGDVVVIVDEVLLPLFEKFRERIDCKHVIVVSQGRHAPDGMLEYESLLESVDAGDYELPELREEQAAAMCYTTGTTGRPKGVVYSHRALLLHSLASMTTATMNISERDVVLPVVPMFHANAWGLPFTSTFAGAKQVFPGPHLDPPSLLQLMQDERVTITGGVPTIWFGLLQVLDKDPTAYDLRSLRTLVVGGSAAPLAMIKGFQERHGLNVLHAWGMTEMAPLGTVCCVPPDLDELDGEASYAYRAKQGRPGPLVELRVRGDKGLVPWDSKTMGELEVKGAWIASGYYRDEDSASKFTDDGWFRTGDIVTIDARGCIEIQDRAKDLIKSGGEWISSVALENALMGHPAVAEAAVVAVPHPRWHERPLAAVVLKEGKQTTADELRDFLATSFSKWWLPEMIEFVSSIPRTSAGKFQKTALREQFKGRYDN